MPKRAGKSSHNQVFSRKLNARSVTSEAAPLRRVTLEVALDDAGRAAALLGAASGELVAVDHREGARTAAVSVYLPGSRAAGALRRIRASVAQNTRDGVLRVVRVRHARFAPRDWVDEWKKHYGPLRLVDGFYIVPTWRGGFTPPRDCDALILDPGMAFGTGKHATTQLAARLLVERVRKGDVVLDAGCGSGILMMVAIARGAQAYGFDNDPVAVRTASTNLKRNSQRAGLVRANRMPGRFPMADIIVANIDAPTLLANVVAFKAKLKRGGVLISSGITARSRLEVLASYARAGLRFASEHRKGEWFAYVHGKS